MVYLAGDNDLDDAGVDDLNEMKKVGSTEDINVVAQFDRQGPKVHTRRYFVGKGGLWKKADLGETDTGSPAVLIDFARWAIKNYPAEHYMLVLWNHGNGWDDKDIYRAARTEPALRNIAQPGRNNRRNFSSLLRNRIPDLNFRRTVFRSSVTRALAMVSTTRGIAYDDTSQDFLDNRELKKALTAIQKMIGRKLDVLGMDACMMNMVEIGYQLRDHVTLVVGSEEIEDENGWPYDKVLDALKSKPQMTGHALSTEIVRCYNRKYDSKSNVTQSACDLSKSEDLGKAIDGLAAALTPLIMDPAMRFAMLTTRAQVQSYYRPDYVDLYDLCGLLAGHCSSKEVQTACVNVQQVIKKERFVVANGSKGSAVKDSHGVSIYFPERSKGASGRISPLYRNLDFAREFRWAAFLRAWLKSLERRARQKATP